MSEEDKKLLLEMKSNCLETRETKKITYNDEKRIKKAKAIDNALKEIERLNNIIKDIEDYINFLVIYNQTISGKFSETQWGQDILGLIGSDKE